MAIIYDDAKKDLPVEPLYHLFFSAGWAGSESTLDPTMLKNFNIPFIHSTLVVSAWEKERLIGAVRVLSDTIIRAVIYDLVIDPAYQKKGIGRELVSRCMAHYPDAEWLLETTEKNIGFYEKMGFTRSNGVFFSIPSVYQRTGHM